MPFARIPESGSLQLPASPDFTRAGNLAAELIARRPIIDYAGAVDKAVGQISNILNYSSPQAKLQRQLQQMQLQYQYQNWQGYKNNPNDYIMTQNGPLNKNSLEALKQMAEVKLATGRAGLYDFKSQNKGPDQNTISALDAAANSRIPSSSAASNVGNAVRPMFAPGVTTSVPANLNPIVPAIQGPNTTTDSSGAIPTSTDANDQPLQDADGNLIPGILP